MEIAGALHGTVNHQAVQIDNIAGMGVVGSRVEPVILTVHGENGENAGFVLEMNVSQEKRDIAVTAELKHAFHATGVEIAKIRVFVTQVIRKPRVVEIVGHKQEHAIRVASGVHGERAQVKVIVNQVQRKPRVVEIVEHRQEHAIRVASGVHGEVAQVKVFVNQVQRKIAPLLVEQQALKHAPVHAHGEIVIHHQKHAMVSMTIAMDNVMNQGVAWEQRKIAPLLVEQQAQKHAPVHAHGETVIHHQKHAMVSMTIVMDNVMNQGVAWEQQRVKIVETVEHIPEHAIQVASGVIGEIA